MVDLSNKLQTTKPLTLSETSIIYSQYDNSLFCYDNGGDKSITGKKGIALARLHAFYCLALSYAQYLSVQSGRQSNLVLPNMAHSSISQNKMADALGISLNTLKKYLSDLSDCRLCIIKSSDIQLLSYQKHKAVVTDYVNNCLLPARERSMERITCKRTGVINYKRLQNKLRLTSIYKDTKDVYGNVTGQRIHPSVKVPILKVTLPEYSDFDFSENTQQSASEKRKKFESIVSIILTLNQLSLTEKKVHRLKVNLLSDRRTQNVYAGNAEVPTRADEMDEKDLNNLLYTSKPLPLNYVTNQKSSFEKRFLYALSELKGSETSKVMGGSKRNRKRHLEKLKLVLSLQHILGKGHHHLDKVTRSKKTCIEKTGCSNAYNNINKYLVGKGRFIKLNGIKTLTQTPVPIKNGTLGTEVTGLANANTYRCKHTGLLKTTLSALILPTVTTIAALIAGSNPDKRTGAPYLTKMFPLVSTYINWDKVAVEAAGMSLMDNSKVFDYFPCETTRNSNNIFGSAIRYHKQLLASSQTKLQNKLSNSNN